MIKSSTQNLQLLLKTRTIVVRQLIFTIVLLCASVTASMAAIITSFAPASGPVDTLISIKGTELSSAKSITIGGVAAIIISNSSTKIVAMVMPGATTGVIVTTFTAGATSAKGNFIVTQTPYPIAQQGRKLVDTAKTSYWFPDYARGEGNSVALSADGNTAIVCEGAAYNFYGTAIIYTRQNGRWVLACPSIRLEAFGSATTVAISADGSTAVIGGNEVSLPRAVVVLRRVNKSWSNPIVEYLKNPDYYPGNLSYHNTRPLVIGNKVSITADGKTILIGTGTIPQPFNFYSDTVRIFNRTGNEWKQAPNPYIRNYKQFGHKEEDLNPVGNAVAISADGKTVVLVAGDLRGGRYGIGAHAGHTIIYNRATRTSNNWLPQKLLPRVDRVCLSADGNTMVATYDKFVFGWGDAPGASYVYTRSGKEWSLLQGIDEAGEASLSADGNTLMIANNATVYTREGGGTFVKKFVLKPGFAGTSASISADGTTAFVGNPDDATTVVIDPENNLLAYRELGAVYAFSSSQPELPAGAITFTNTTGSTTSVSWINGSGTGRAVFIKDTTAGEPSPVDIYYSSNVRYHSGYQIDKTGWFCIYNGTGSAVNVVGLTGGKTYRVAVMEYKGTVDKPFFLQTEIEPANVITPIVPPNGYATNLVFSNTMATSTTLNWVSSSGAARAVFLHLGTSGALNLVQGQTYAASATFGQGDMAGTNGWYCVYNGTGNSVNLSGLSASSTYRAIVIEYNGTAGGEAYNLSRYNGANVTTAGVTTFALTTNQKRMLVEQDALTDNTTGELNIHQGMSPNGDGQNDVFTIDGIGAYPQNTVKIMNSNGDVVYNVSGYDNYEKAFNGHSADGTLQKAGTYFYSLEYKKGDEMIRKTGYLVIKY